MLPRLRFIFDRSLTVSNCLEKSIAAYGPDMTILGFSGDQSALGTGTQSLTLGELQKIVNRIANALVSLGLRRFDRVAIYKRGAVDYLIFTLAIVRAGAITVPINGGMRREDVRHYLRYTGSRLVFVDAAGLAGLDRQELASGERIAIVTDAMAENAPGICNMKRLLSAQSDQFDPVPIARHDDVMIVHTSGTTGFPKGVLHGSDSLIRAAKGQLTIQPLTRNNRVLLGAPANHHITQAALFTCLASGVAAYVPSGETPEQFLRLIEREHCSLVLAFPDMYQALCSLPLEHYRLGHVKAWMAGGDSSHEVHIRRLTALGGFLHIFGRTVIRSLYVEFLGTSEIGFAALLKISTSFTRRYGRYVGRPTPVSPRVKVADAAGRKLPAGVPGRLMVKGPTLFKGYWNSHESLHGVQIDGWWWTGDIARRDRMGRYYHLDRATDVIRSHGQDIYSLPLEEELLRHPAVQDVAVIALEDAPHPVGAVIELRTGAALSTDALANWMHSTLRLNHDIRLLILPAGELLPRGLTGKVLKRRLRQRFSIPVIDTARSHATALADPQAVA
jgi:long-chain acyl-CoA synthetase